jgi:hypothetical protein
MKAHLLVLSTLIAAIPAFSQDFKQDFESVPEGYFEPLRGKAHEGSTLEISTEKSRSAQKSVKINYKFTERGFVTPHVTQRPVVATTDGKLNFSIWVYGAGQKDFTSTRLRLIDAGGEIFQYDLGPKMIEALNGTGWREVNTEIDLTQNKGSFGGKKNDVLDMPLKFFGLGLTHDITKAAEGTIYLDDLKISPLTAAPTAVAKAPTTATKAGAKVAALSLEPLPAGNGLQLYIYPPNSTVTTKIKANRAAFTGNQIPTAVQWTARDYDNRIVAQGKQPLDAAGGGEVKVKAPPTGIVYINATLMADGDVALGEAETRFAVLRPRPIPASVKATDIPTLYGVATHLQRENGIEAEREVALMSALGFRACRMDFSWSQIQPKKDEYRWEVFDRIINLFEQHRIAPAPILGFSTRWATTGDLNSKDWKDWSNAPPITADYVNFARESVRRYKRTVKHWEIWNEPDISFWRGTAEQYATLFDATNKAIHEEDPTAKVINGGWSQVRRRPDFIPTWHKLVQTKPDIYAYHSHNSFANMLRSGDEVKQYMAFSNWKMPVWLNEAGFTSHGSVSEQAQARLLIKRMGYAPVSGYDGYFWYDLRNDGYERSEPEHNYGLVRRDFTPKAAAVAAHTLMETLEGQRFVRRIAVPGTPDAYALLYERPNGAGGTMLLWNEAEATVPLFWRVPANATHISVMGEKTALKSSNGLIALAAMPEPQFLSFTGSASQFAVAARFLDFDSPVIAGPSETVSLRLALRNPLAQPLQGSLSLQPSGGWKVEASELTYNVPANSSREWNVKLTAPATMEGIHNLNVSLKSASLPAGANAQIRLQSALVIPRVATVTGDLSRQPRPLATIGKNNIVSLFEATPMQELLFKGDNDLSARLDMVRVPQGLRFTVRVQDDIFEQKEGALEAWRGDSIQWGIALPTGEQYEWLAALLGQTPTVRLNNAPSGVERGNLQIPATIRREGSETLYDITLPATLPGGKPLPDRFSFSFLVNDNDGAGRKGWVELTPGIGRNKSIAQYQSLLIK